MNDRINNNHGASLPNGGKTKLESQIEVLQAQEQQIIKRLKTWETKAKKANNLASCLETADKFASQFLTAAVEAENNCEQVDKCQLERLIRNQIEFNLKFEAGCEVFAKLIRESVEREVRVLRDKLENIQSQIQHQERKFARLQARRQSKVLLDCEYKKPIGCLGSYQCQSCQANYSASESNQLKGGAY